MSRFVPAGADREPSDRDEEWAQAQNDVEARRREQAEVGRQEGGKSLYETLQANKAAKQEQFEESIRLKNQFRSLDEDEVQFLDSVRESEKAKEAEAKKEAREQLDAFRQQQEEAERRAKAAAPSVSVESIGTTWTVGPRRKRKARDDVRASIKARRLSTSEKPAGEPGSPPAHVSGTEHSHKNDRSAPQIRSKGSKDAQPALPVANNASLDPVASNVTPSTSVGLGLVNYHSDEDD